MCSYLRLVSVSHLHPVINLVKMVLLIVLSLSQYLHFPYFPSCICILRTALD